MMNRGRAVAATLLAVVVVSGGFLFGGWDSTIPATLAGQDRGMRELRELVARFEGRPPVVELSRFESGHSRTKAAALARLLRGYLALESGDAAYAASALDESIGEMTALGDYALLYRGRAQAKLGRFDDANHTLKKVHRLHPDSLLAREASLEAARAALSESDDGDALEALAPLVSAGDGEALVLAAGIAERKGDTAEATKLARAAYFYDPASEAARAALEKLQAGGADPALAPATPAELRARADRLYEAGQWAAARDAYGRVVAETRSLQDRDLVNLKRGIAAAAARDVDAAAASLLAVGPQNAELHAEALYRLATAYRVMGRDAEFDATGARLRSSYPKSEWTGRYLGDKLALLDARKRTGEMAPVLQAIMEAHPRVEKGAEVSYELAWLHYKTGDYARAAELFLDHLSVFRSPTSKWIGEAAFWGGRANERSGNAARALFFYNLASERYPYGYHGHVARERALALGRSNPGVKPEAPRPGSKLAAARENALYVVPLVETADERADARIAKGRDLRSIALWDHAIREISAAQKLFPESQIVNLRLAQVYRDKGEYFQATVVLRKGYPDIYSYRDEQLPREAWEIQFPLTHWDTIKQKAAANGLDPFVVAGLIRQESVFNPQALSRANARGLMQLLPSTGRLVAKTSGLGTIGAADLYNPQLNITLGTAYFSQQLRNFGRVEYAAAAYNAGPGRVVQWKNARPNMDMEEWVENIPISETRGYVMGVLRYSFNYRRFYGKGDQRGGSDD